MDDWVRAASCDLSTVEWDGAAEKEGGGGGGGGRKRDGRRREEPPAGHGGNAHGPAHDEEHAEFDAVALRQHEEHTKASTTPEWDLPTTAVHPSILPPIHPPISTNHSPRTPPPQVRNILRVELGKHEMDTWYFSPFPAEYNDCSKLFFCEFTLAFFKRKEQLRRHLRKNELLHPPGDEIYRHAGVSMFEVDGRKEKIYCQNLCYLAKLFLDHKRVVWPMHRGVGLGGWEVCPC